MASPFEELNSLYGRHILIKLPPCEPLITIREKHYEKKDMGTVGKNSILANIYRVLRYHFKGFMYALIHLIFTVNLWVRWILPLSPFYREGKGSQRANIRSVGRLRLELRQDTSRACMPSQDTILSHLFVCLFVLFTTPSFFLIFKNFYTLFKGYFQLQFFFNF